MPSYPLYRWRNGTSALASRGLRCSGQHSISFYRLTVHIRAPIRDGAVLPQEDYTSNQLRVHCDTIMWFLRSQVVELWFFWINSPLFAHTQKQNNNNNKKGKTSHLKKAHPLKQAEAWVRTYWNLLVTECPRNTAGIGFLFDSCDRWQCEMATKGKRRMLEGWDCEGLGPPCQKPRNEYNGSSGEKPIHLFKGLALLQCKNQVKNIFILDLCINKKTKTHFSERSRFMWPFFFLKISFSETGPCYVAQAGIQLKTLGPQPPEFWEYSATRPSTFPDVSFCKLELDYSMLV